jgi:heat induced stress protein YflT
MAVSAYLPDQPGGMVVGASFADEAAASAALDLLRASGVRRQDISVLARDARRAERLAADRAWTPSRNARGPGILRRVVPAPGLPGDVKRRYAETLRAAQVVLLVAADGQPADTIAALFDQAHGERIEQWWQRSPAALFAPPDMAGPF